VVETWASMNCGALEAFGPRGRLFTLTLYEGPASVVVLPSFASHRFWQLSVYIGSRRHIIAATGLPATSLWIRGSSIAIVALQLLGAGGC
jgi:hypothetical protein